MGLGKSLTSTMPSVGSGTYSPGPNRICLLRMKVRTGSVDAMTRRVYPDLRSLATVSNFSPSCCQVKSKLTYCGSHTAEYPHVFPAPPGLTLDGWGRRGQGPSGERNFSPRSWHMSPTVRYKPQLAKCVKICSSLSLHDDVVYGHGSREARSHGSSSSTGRCSVCNSSAINASRVSRE